MSERDCTANEIVVFTKPYKRNLCERKSSRTPFVADGLTLYNGQRRPLYGPNYENEEQLH